MNTEHTERLFYKERKGQSAIEYLMTYGWMLLVVAIVGGAIFATVQGQCTQSSSGFTGQDLSVAEFGVAEVGGTQVLQIDVQNTGADSVEVDSAVLTDEDDGTVADSVYYNATDPSDGNAITLNSSNPLDIGVGTSESIYIENVGNSDGCNTFDLEFGYDMGNLNSQSISGTLTDQMEITG